MRNLTRGVHKGEKFQLRLRQVGTSGRGCSLAFHEVFLAFLAPTPRTRTYFVFSSVWELGLSWFFENMRNEQETTTFTDKTNLASQTERIKGKQRVYVRWFCTSQREPDCLNIGRRGSLLYAPLCQTPPSVWADPSRFWRQAASWYSWWMNSTSYMEAKS